MAGVLRHNRKKSNTHRHLWVLVGWYDFCMHINLFNYNFDKHTEE
jgi:hypothetical protein